MLGSMLNKIRKENKITQVSVANAIGVDVGHITHIEKGQRIPSHKTLKNICKFFNIPYSLISSLYDKKITEDQQMYDVLNHISYNKVPLVSSIDGFVDCNASKFNASIAILVDEDCMEPTLKHGSYAFVELNSPLDNKDIGVFRVRDNTLIRRFIVRKDKIILRADNKIYPDIDLSEKDDFTIIGRIYESEK